MRWYERGKSNKRNNKVKRRHMECCCCFFGCCSRVGNSTMETENGRAPLAPQIRRVDTESGANTREKFIIPRCVLADNHHGPQRGCHVSAINSEMRPTAPMSRAPARRLHRACDVTSPSPPIGRDWGEGGGEEKGSGACIGLTDFSVSPH